VDRPVPIERVRLPATREAWLAARGIGGSEVGAILGCSPWAGPWDVLAARVRPLDRDTPTLARGRRFERIALELYAEQTGLHVCAPGAPYAHDGPVVVVADFERTINGAESQHNGASEGVKEPISSARSWATYSPDGWAYGPEGWGLVEAKTSTQPGEWGEAGFYTPDQAAEHVPAHYLAQVLWGLEVTGLPWCDLTVLLPYYEVRVYRIYADAALQRDLLAQVGAWRQAHLVEGRPLNVDGSQACRRVVEREPTDPGREATQEEAALLQSLWGCRNHVTCWQRQADWIANMLLLRMGPAERVYTQDGWRATRKNGLRVWQPKEK